MAASLSGLVCAFTRDPVNANNIAANAHEELRRKRVRTVFIIHPYR